MSVLARSFSPIARIAAGGGPTKTMPACFAGLGEVGILGQEAIARMNAFGAGLAGGRDHALDRKIAFTRLGAADAIGLVA